MKKKGKETLLIRAPRSPEEDFRWMLIGSEEPTAEGIMTTIENLPLRKNSCRILFLLPSSLCVLWQEPLVKKRGRPSATSLLWHREEHLLVDAEELHAGYILQGVGSAWLAAVEMSLLRGWLDKLDNWNLTPSAIFPDVALLPVGRGVCLDAEWILRNGEMDARIIPQAALKEWPEVGIADSLITQQRSWNLESMQCFNGAIPSGPGLLTDSFRPRMRLRNLRGKRLLGVVLGLWLLSFVILQSAQRWQISHKNQLEQTELRLMAQRAFTNVPDDVPIIPWLEKRMKEAPTTSKGLSNFLQDNQDFFRQIDQGSIHGMRWEAESHKLEFNIKNASATLPKLVEQVKTQKRTITLIPNKGKNMVKISVQEQGL